MSSPHQDWTPVILRKANSKANSNTEPVPKTHINKPKNGIKVEKIYDPNDLNAEPETKPVMIGLEFGQQIQKARSIKGITQKELANALSIPVSVINDYERGTGVHDHNFVNKIKKYLGITKKINQ